MSEKPTTAKAAPVQADDILSAILTLAKRLSEGATFAVVGHDFELQRIFSELRQEHPIIQQHFVFSDAGPVPYSPILNESISRLQLAGLVGRQNPDYKVLFLEPAAEAYYDRVLQASIDPARNRELQEVAQSFVKRAQLRQAASG